METCCRKKEVYEYYYKAYDGTEFKSESDCVEYEKSPRFTITTAFEKFSEKNDLSDVALMVYAPLNADHYIRPFYLENAEALKAFNDFVLFISGDKKLLLSEENIGEIVCLVEDYGDYWVVTKSDVENYCKALMNLFDLKNIERKEEK